MKKSRLILVLFLVFTHAFVAQQGIPKRGFAVDWLMPRTSSNPPIDLYSKIELGIFLSDSLHEQITQFLESRKKGLDPFDPQDVDIFAEFSFLEKETWSKPKRINAFYFEDFKRNTRDPNLKNWNWEQVKAPTKFRVRFTPDQLGKWHFVVKINIRGKNLITLGEYDFSCIKSSRTGFVRCSNSKKSLELNGKSFVPIGQNLAEPSCFVGKNADNSVFDPYGCAACPCPSGMVDCDQPDFLPMHPKAYVVYLDELKKLKNAGGNFVRMSDHKRSFGAGENWTYSGRMHVAWELDQFFEIAEKLDVKVYLNLSSIADVSDPESFFIMDSQKQQFKNYLRYVLARWGSSTSHAVVELMEDAAQFPDYSKEVFAWQQEMSRFIKEDLDHRNQLLAINFKALPSIAAGTVSIPFEDVIGYSFADDVLYGNELHTLKIQLDEIGKLVLLKELGFPGTEHSTCFNPDPWLKNLWLPVFSEFPNSGLNVSGTHQSETWKYFSSLSNFVSGIDFESFSMFTSSISKDLKSEILFLFDGKNQRGIGLVQNATWNYYTSRKDKTCFPDRNPGDVLSEFETIASKKRQKSLVIKGLNKRSEYEISWYNPMTGKFIHTEVFYSSGKGILRLKHPKLTVDCSFLAFKLNQKGKPFSEVKKVESLEKIELKKDPELENH